MKLFLWDIVSDDRISADQFMIQTVSRISKDFMIALSVTIKTDKKFTI